MHVEVLKMDYLRENDPYPYGVRLIADSFGEVCILKRLFNGGAHASTISHHGEDDARLDVIFEDLVDFQPPWIDPNSKDTHNKFNPSHHQV